MGVPNEHEKPSICTPKQLAHTKRQLSNRMAMKVCVSRTNRIRVA